MKYIVVLGDGMADEPIESLEGKTPLEYAATPVMDDLAGKGQIGLAYMIPEGMKPGSDTANLAVLGYNPKNYYTGRSPLEALSIGVDMKDTDIAIRCNIVTVSEEDGIPYGRRTIIDHSSGEISTEDAAVLLDAVKKELGSEIFQYYAGTSYRHLLIWDHGNVAELIPPHDILGRKIGKYLPEEPALKEMMKKSFDILNNPINIERAKRGLNKANSIWFWGAGTRPKLDSFEEKTGKKGVMISAVDLLKGIAVGTGMKNINVPGADGTLHTNYEGKAMAAVTALLEDDYDFAYIHVEAPDEMGHQGNIKDKIEAIESLDAKVIAVVKREMDASEKPYRMLVLPDHPTPVRLRTHTAGPVPYTLYDNTMERRRIGRYNEAEAEMSGNVVQEGYRLIEQLFA